MIDDLEELFYLYQDEIDAGRTPDLARPPYDSPEFHAFLKKFHKIDRTLKFASKEEAVSFAIPDIPGVRIVREIDRGGMGVVYLARDLSLDRDVAVKVIPKMNNEQNIRRFKQESKLLAKFNHANIVAVLHHGETPDYFYYVMPFIDGLPLDRIIRLVREDRFARASEVFAHIAAGPAGAPAPGSRQTALDAAYIDHAVRVMLQISAALECAHRQGIIHRDIKPSNIICDANGTARIVDFGISRVVAAPSMTLTHELIGTPHYLSPEIIAGRDATAASDVYSLGVVLFELLALQPPFNDKTIGTLCASIKEKQPPNLRSIRAETPDALNDIVQICLEKNPADRYPDMSALLADLERFQRGETRLLASRSSGRKIARAARRPVVIAGAVALAVALLAWAGLAVHRPESSPFGGMTRSHQLDPSIKINIQTGKGGGGAEYEAGERLTIRVTANCAGFLRLYYIQADGSVLQLLPNRYRTDDRIDTAAEYIFPDDRDRFELIVNADPPGQEAILAVVSSLPFEHQEVPRDILEGVPVYVVKEGVGGMENAIRFKGLSIHARRPIYNWAYINIKAIRGGNNHKEAMKAGIEP